MAWGNMSEQSATSSSREDSLPRTSADNGAAGPQTAETFRTHSISVPKGGGAIGGIGEKFAVNPATGTASLSVPVFTNPSRSGFGPQLSLNYDSGAGNGPFGFGVMLSSPF